MLEKKTLREWRDAAGLTQDELAELAGCSSRSVSDVELGRLRLSGRTGQRLMRALDVTSSEIVPVSPDETVDNSDWQEWAADSSAPARNLLWWRNERSLSVWELAGISGVAYSTIGKIENGQVDRVMPHTRRRLARALKISPAKLIVPGDDIQPTPVQSWEAELRADLRGARRVLRRWQDVAKDGRYLTNKAYDDLASLIEDTERELRGT